MKQKITFLCGSCGHQELKWMGRCPECGTWNSFQKVEADRGGRKPPGLSVSIPLSAIETEEKVRWDTGNGEVNRVLGGGLMKSSSVLLGGEPGIGKSTLVLQIAQSLVTRGRILYVSGEESEAQIRMRADRLGIASDTIEIFCETELAAILSVLDKVKPVLLIVDSVQTILSEEGGSVPGTVSQIKLCTQELNSVIKRRGVSLILIGHVTKEGIIAGPKVIEHMVDTVLYFDGANSAVRFLRSTKNRFGSTDEIGIFQMTEKGLSQVRNPASIFLEHREGSPPAGVAVAPVYEGSRVLLVEIQSLVVPAKGGISRVFSDRIDSRRVSRIAAVLEKHLNIPFSTLDVYVNVAGGMRIEEVGTDLALAMALYSAKTGLSLPSLTAVIGEVSLAGEIRGVPHVDRRIRSSREMGFKQVIGPRNKDTANSRDFYQEVSTLEQAVRTAFIPSAEERRKERNSPDKGAD
jgi:DNA repair protein RadA/Sms